ncbi:MAG: HipA N-terminal domain-containing protein [Bacteroidota bacterium]|uniref:Serine/threonine-protein kinase HipA n=1 Tax=Algoriphagus faecimaris TaxID=686796 RepID=A0A1G6MJI8_9BACT|nr:HipA N-terminal domain-containing protein [Algoriphagus faecimaris]SDC55454.1 serine/threonine-protein kinase HipA [Algoriphagus faecimaris]
MRRAAVLRNGELVGLLIKESPKQYRFVYDEAWLNDPTKPSISLTLPKVQKEFVSDHLFPFFFNMLSEGVNLKLQARRLQIDENDFFSLLLQTSTTDTIGAVTLKEL